MWGLIVAHSKQAFRFNCVHFNKVPLYLHTVKPPFKGSSGAIIVIYYTHTYYNNIYIIIVI